MGWFVMPGMAAWLAGSALASGVSSPPPPPPPAVDFGALPATATGRGPDHNGKPHPVTARLLVDGDHARPGDTVRVGIHLTQEDGWHTYWKSPGDIGQPTEVAWTALDGATVGPLAFPVPQRFEQDGQISFGYADQVLLSAELTVPANAPAGPSTLGADVNWLVCFTSCIPGSTHLEVPLVVGPEPPAPSVYRPLFDHYAAQHPVDAAASGLVVEAVQSTTGLTVNTPFRAAFVLRSPAGPLAVPAGQKAWPTFTPIASSYDWGVTGLKFASLPDGALAVVIEGETYEPDPIPTHDQIGGLVQVDLGGKLVRAEVTAPLTWAPAGAAVAAVEHPAFAAVAAVATAEPGSEKAPAEPAPVAIPAAVAAGGPPAGAASLLSNLLLAFVGGLILNVMPCVLPVLTLKLYGLVEQSDITAGQRRATGLAYSAGVIASFWLLAAVVLIARTAFGVQMDWGFQFQYPPYVAALTTIVFVFGLSLVGVFEIPVVGADAADNASNREGLVGSFFTGVFATLLATPCSAPFLGTAVAYAFGAPTPVLVAVFTLVGAGLAAPFLLVAFVPVLFRFLPKPGAWMDTFKQLLGFTLIATTVWLCDVLLAEIGGDRTIGFLSFLVAVALGCWVYGRWGGLAETGRRQLAAFGVAIGIATVGGVGFLDLRMAEASECDAPTEVGALDYSAHIPWVPFSEPTLAGLDGKPVFIDFTAEWCLTCKVNERTILEQPGVREVMGRLSIVPLKADWTRRDEVITRWLRDHGRAGVPMYLVIPADRSQPPILLPEVITPGMVVEALHTAAGST